MYACTACTNRALPKFSQSQSHFVEMPKMHHGQSFVSLLLIVHVTKAGRKETCPHIGLSERSPASTKDLVLHVVQRLCISVGPELGHSKSNIQVYIVLYYIILYIIIIYIYIVYIYT